MKQQSLLPKLIWLTVLLGIGIGSCVYASTVYSERSQPAKVITGPSQQTTGGGGDPIYLTIDGLRAEALPNGVNATTLYSQLYTLQYQKTGKIERYAVVEGATKSTYQSLSFTLRFLPSGNRFNVTIDVKNSATSYYDLTMEKM